MPTTDLLSACLLTLAGCPRVLGLVALTPGFDAATIPPLVRLALGVGLAVALSPLLAQSPQALLELPVEGYVLVLVSELLVGLAMGFGLSCLLEAARLAGELVDMQIGFQAGEMYDPVSGAAASVLGRLWFFAALVIFFQVGGPHWLMQGLARSYQLCPVGQVVAQPHLAAWGAGLLTALLQWALRLAAPVMASLLLADLALGLIGRGMPQMNLLMVGMPAKIVVGLAALVLCSPALTGQLTALVSETPALLRQVLLLLR